MSSSSWSRCECSSVATREVSSRSASVSAETVWLSEYVEAGVICGLQNMERVSARFWNSALTPLQLSSRASSSKQPVTAARETTFSREA